MIDHTAASVHARTLAQMAKRDPEWDLDPILAEWHEALVEWVESAPTGEAHMTRLEMIRKEWPEFNY